MRKGFAIFLLSIFLVGIFSCKKVSVIPREKAYPHIDICDTTYAVEHINGIKLFVNTAAIATHTDGSEFVDILYPKYNCTITLTLKKIQGKSNNEIDTIVSHISERRMLNIGDNFAIEKEWLAPEGKRWSVTCYEVSGKCPTPLLFEVADKQREYIPSGVIFFNNSVVYDSVYPIITALENDVLRLFGRDDIKDNQIGKNKCSTI